MKKKILFLLSTLFISINVVCAVEEGDSVSLKEYNYDGYRYSYSLTDSNGTSFLAFCLDYSDSNGIGSSNVSSTYKVADQIGNRDYDNSTLLEYFDYLVVSIFEDNPDSSINSDDYAAITLALRTIVSVVGYDEAGTNVNCFKALGASWAETDTTLAGYISAINESLSDNGSALFYSGSSDISGCSFDFNVSDIESTKSAAKEVYKSAMAKLVDYIFLGESSTGDANFTYSTTPTEEDGYIVQTTVLTANEYFLFDYKETISFDIANYDEDNLELTCERIYNGDLVEFDCDSTEEFLVHDTSGSIGFVITAKVEVQEMENLDSECIFSNYEINYTVKSSTINGTVYKATYNDSSSTASSGFQRFYFYVPEGEKEESISLSIGSCISEDCEPDYTTFTDCDDAIEDQGLNTWFILDYYAPSNLGCIVNGTDYAGNSYVVEGCEYEDIDIYADGDEDDYDNGMSDVEDNPYCTVSCSEDYEYIKFPGVIEVDSGRYIKLGATIAGTKTCTTSNIDYEQFADDIIELQQDMIDAYNEYWKNKTAVEEIVTAEKEDCKSCCGSGTYTPSIKMGYIEVDDKTEIAVFDGYYYINDYGTVGFNYTTGENTILDIEETNSYTESDSGSSGSCCYDTEEKKCSSDCDKACESADVSYYKKQFESAYEEAEENLEEAQENYNNAIESIVACAGEEIADKVSSNFEKLFSDDEDLDGWEMLFPLVPYIEFDYDEENYMDAIDDDDDKFLDITSVEYFIKDSKIDDDEMEDYIEDGDYEDDEVDYNEAEFSYYTYDDGELDTLKSTTVDSIDFVYCTVDDGCETVTYEDFPSADLDYVEAEISKVIEYETPEIFYQSAYQNDKQYYKDISDFDKYTLVGGLPINLSTETSDNYDDYEFSYTIYNWGEYYDECTGGRISDELDNLEKDKLYTCNSKGVCTYEYVCYYAVNLEVDDDGECPDCDVDTDLNYDFCVTCLVDGTFTLYFRTISNTNTGSSSSDDVSDSFNSNDRDLGYNWNYTYSDSDTIYSFIGGKAESTLSAIYSIETNSAYSGEAILTVELTPSVASDIRDYNSVAGDYSDYTLSCYDYETDDYTYENVFCYSDLLTEWEGDYVDNFTFIDSRTGNINKDAVSEDVTDDAYWKVYTTNISTDYYIGSIGGPSWK